MDEKDLKLQRLQHDLARWKGRAIEVAQEACTICKAYADPEEDDCKICRMKKVQEEISR